MPLAGALSFGAFPLIEFQRNGRLANEDLKGGETELLQFAVNQIDGFIYGTTRPQGWGEARLEAFVEPASGTAVAGLPRIGDVFVVRKNSKPLWVPFPLADALQPVAVDRRTLYENRRDAYAKQVAEFAEWRTPASRAARRADWKQSAALMGAKGAEFLANMEKSDPQIEAANETQLGAGGPEDKAVREAERELKEVDGVLAALSPDQRRAPSCYDGQGRRAAARFRLKEGAPASCRALVRPNWAYFDATLPRSAPAGRDDRRVHALPATRLREHGPGRVRDQPRARRLDGLGRRPRLAGPLRRGVSGRRPTPNSQRPTWQRLEVWNWELGARVTIFRSGSRDLP